MQPEGRLREALVFDMTLLYLAKHRETHYEDQTFNSARVKLKSMVFPESVEVRKIYFAFWWSQVNLDDETEKDLQIYEGHSKN